MSEPNSSGNWRTQTPGCTPQPAPPASDLGAIRPDLEVFLAQLATWREMEAVQIRALLDAYDTQAARLAAQQPVIDAVLKLSTYSRETVDDGVRRIMEASDEYEEWLLEHPDAH